MSEESHLIHRDQAPIGGSLRAMMQGPVAAVQQHDVPWSQFQTVAELVWISIRCKHGNGSPHRYGEPGNTRQDFRDFDQPHVWKGCAGI